MDLEKHLLKILSKHSLTLKKESRVMGAHSAVQSSEWDPRRCRILKLKLESEKLKTLSNTNSNYSYTE